MSGRLAGKIAIVTGAGSAGAGYGNGKAAAVRFAQEGAKVCAVDRVAEAAEETAEIIRSEGGECLAITADVTDEEGVNSLVSRCVEAFGRVDVLLNNVGILAAGGLENVSIADWERVFSVNVTAVLLCCRAVLPHMREQGGGSIVNVSSIASLRSLGVHYVAYPSSKAAVNGLTLATAVEYGPHNIRCNAIFPGFIRTPMVEQQVLKAMGSTDPSDLDAYYASREAVIPLRRLGESWDVANAALFLASDESQYITGIELVVDGGVINSVGLDT